MKAKTQEPGNKTDDIAWGHTHTHTDVHTHTKSSAL